MLVREYLQARILGLMAEAGAMVSLAFQGGTALRFLYDMPRFSEDLDFALEAGAGNLDLGAVLERTRSALAREGYDTRLRKRLDRTVQSVMVRFPGLPYELGLSPRNTQVLSIRVDMDSSPPAGAGLEVSLVRRYVPLRLQHHDRPSLLAGKIHAVLTREYAKGRDYYDLMWYMGDSDWPQPNMDLLGNALQQSGWPARRIEDLDLPQVLDEMFCRADWPAIRRDVAPFLERPAEADFLNRDDMTALLESFFERKKPSGLLNGTRG